MISDLPAGWRRVRTETVASPDRYALATGPFGSAISSRHFISTGVPVIRGSNLSESVGTRLSHDKLVFISKELAAKFQRSEVRRGDLVFTCWGTIGQVGLIDSTAEYKSYIVSNKQMKLTPDPSVADSLFLYYVFSSPEIVSTIQSQKIGSSVPGFNLGQLKGIEIPLPPLDEQKRISGVLGELDEKIRLHRDMNRTLLAIGNAIFKSWFARFDAVVAAELTETEIGSIPSSWKIKPLLEIVDILSGGTPRTSNPNFWGGELKWASAKDVSNCPDRYLIDTDRTITETGLSASPTKVIPAGAVVVVARGATCGRWCLMGEPIAMNQTCYALVPRTPEFGNYTKYLIPALLDGLVRQAHGSVFDTITTRTFRSVRIPVPPASLLARFDSVVEPLETRILENIYSSRTLARIRDSLLPRLIAGEVRVPEAFSQLEDLS